MKTHSYNMNPTGVSST